MTAEVNTAPTVSARLVTQAAKRRLVVITNGNYFANLILTPLFGRKAWQVVGVVIVKGDYNGRTGVAAVLHYLRVTTLPYAVYKIFTQAWFTVAAVLFGKIHLTVRSRAVAADILIREVPSINAPDVSEWITDRRPDLLISVSCPQRISPGILACAPFGGINVHSSLLPKYGGLAPYFWVLSHGETTTGCSVHFMTKHFDGGRVIAQKAITIQPHESAFHLFCRLARVGAELLQQTVEGVLGSSYGIEQDSHGRSYYSHPTAVSYIRMRRNGYVLAHFGELWRCIADARAEGRADRS